MGRPTHVGPVGLWRYNDPDEVLLIQLIVFRAAYGIAFTPTPRDNHWMIAWRIGQTSEGHTVQRQVQIVQESGLDHLTNWGPITSATDKETEKNAVAVDITTMTLAQRQTLEHIANTTRVRVPNGDFNGQDWIISVLQEAVAQGLVEQAELERAVTTASNVQPKTR
ncbi:hypothetical protein PLICRDRAFT_49983 [Plicaturopsis crispa FD-325 SS-3]|nr:hypothetical protein PLICRDRAFT_49983 [Plicaturopsis crispa FD-325 SS-3]